MTSGLSGKGIVRRSFVPITAKQIFLYAETNTCDTEVGIWEDEPWVKYGRDLRVA